MDQIDFSELKAVFVNCTLKKSPDSSHTQDLMNVSLGIMGSPIWLGEKSSIAQKLIERLYGMSGEKNPKGQYLYYGKVGGCIITGIEDGVKHCAMGILYSLQHLGYSIPPRQMPAGSVRLGRDQATLMQNRGLQIMTLPTGILRL